MTPRGAPCTDHAVFRAYRDHADEAMTIFLTPASARGKWAGRSPSHRRMSRSTVPSPR
jgi:hypothetical protein